MELIRLVNIHKTYHLGEVDVPVLRGVSLSIEHGEMVALMGASGSGKSTLMNILGCLDRPSSGEFWFNGREMSKLSSNERAMIRTEKIGFVFQNFNLLARTTAIQNVMMPLDYSTHRPSERETWSKAFDLLNLVGLESRLDHTPSQMSGGQQQRVAISRSLINSPMFLLADEPTGNLDSRTSVEILQMFQKLNTNGITVLLVTHDPDVAKYAHRTIRIVDGLIENSDESLSQETPSLETLVQEIPSVVPATKHADVLPREKKYQGKKAASGGNLSWRQRLASMFPVTFRTAFRALRRNKMRSTLSAFGVIIAVAAVIAMTEIGQGSKEMLRKNIASMGANTIIVFSGSASRGGVNRGTGTAMTLTPQDAEEILRQCPTIQNVAPLVNTRVQIIAGNRNCVPDSIYGTTPSYLDVGEWRIASGEMFTDRDVRNSNKVCVIGNTVRKDLFPDESPVGKEIRLNNVSFRVVGLLDRKGANMMGMDQDNVIIAPWTTIKYRVSGSTLTNTNQSSSDQQDADAVNTLNLLYPGSTSAYLSRTAMQISDTPQPVRFTNVDIILAKAVSGRKIEKAVTQITDLLRDRHRIKGEENDFEIRTMAEVMKIISSTTQLMSTLLLIVAMISLLVGGVGIMNIMLVSVTERTREIGLRMAVGARSHHILRQFLVEAMALCLTGGAIGVFLGRGVSILVRIFAHWPIQASFGMILAAVAVSLGVGVIFGFYPAWKASRLDPIDALRYE
ncbi:MAG: ABC transporter permease [Planctomycetaceae bacterium]|nr:ABC transporter permease [Planctomycetaceae bacterium]